MSVLSTPTRTPAAPKRGPSVLSNDSYTENERSVRFRYDQAHAHDPHLPPSPVTPGSHLPPAVGVGVLFADDEEKITPCGATVLALYAPGQNSLAAAFFDPETRRLQVLEDTKDTWGWDLAVLLVEQFQPYELILSAAAPDSLVKLMEELCQENGHTQVTTVAQCQFSHATATYHLAAVRLPAHASSQISWSDSGRGGALSSETGAGQEDDTGAGMGQIRLSLLKMGCRVNVDAPHAVSAVGALLSHLVRTQNLDIKGEEAGLDIEGVESMDFEEHMVINQDALTSIGVFDVESHANMYTQKHRPGLSLNGVINTTITPLGKKLFHTWLLRPLTNIDRINARLDAVQLLSSHEYTGPRQNIKRDMKNIKNIGGFCLKIKSGRASWKDWLGLVESIRAALAIKESLVVFNLRTALEVSKKISEALNDSVHLFLMDIIQLIDWDASRDAGNTHICIRSKVDDEVDEWRENLAGLDVFLSVTGHEMKNRIPENLCEALKVIYLPQLGCLVAVHGLMNEAAVPDDWEKQWFFTDEAIYYKTPEMNQLDSHFGDLQNVIMDREIEWIQALADRLPSVEEGLLMVGEALAELDCLLAFADAVDRFELRRPVMVDKPILKIRNGFHPLHAMCVPTGQYIPNDTLLKAGSGEDAAGMMVVTGANGSGKSAYGKQVALITFMAHIGCFVPAASAEIGICDKIFTRVQTRESSSKTGSAFMIDLSQVSQTLRGATSRSLLILDEFGKGTTTSDGAGLLAGVITYLLAGPNPRTVVLTHYHQLFAQQFIEHALPIIYCHMKSFINEGSNVLTYLYKLSPTLSLTSNAAECALMHGIPTELVERARVVSDCVSKFQITKLIDAQLTDEDMDELAQAEDLTKRFLAWEPHDDDPDLRDQLALMFEVADEPEEVLELGEGASGVTTLERRALSEAATRSAMEEIKEEDEENEEDGIDA